MSNTPENRDDEMRAAFEQFNTLYPQVWVLFEELTFEQINSGRAYFGASAIWEDIRWKTSAGGNGKTEIKVNNNHRRYYALLFVERHPEHKNFFRFRKTASRNKPPRGRPDPTPERLRKRGEQ